MATTSNSTLKGVLAFGALTIGAVMFFVGSADDEGVLSEAASGAGSKTDESGRLAPGPARETGGELTPKPAAQPQASGDVEIVEWDDEALIDTTSGIDPTPESDDPFGAQPTDSTINDVDADEQRFEAKDRALPQVGGTVPIPSTANLPE